MTYLEIINLDSDGTTNLTFPNNTIKVEHPSFNYSISTMVIGG